MCAKERTDIGTLQCWNRKNWNFYCTIEYKTYIIALPVKILKVLNRLIRYENIYIWYCKEIKITTLGNGIQEIAIRIFISIY
jgi:hypothetical protein